MPLAGSEGTGVNAGQYRKWNAVKTTEGFDALEWLKLTDQERKEAPLPQYQYSSQILDFSSLLVPQDPDETTLESFRIFNDVQYPGERYIMVYSFNNTTYADGWPLRFYIRAAGDLTVESFSEAATVNNPAISTTTWVGGQLAARSAGGWRLQYSSSQAKFVTATIYLTAPGEYKEVVAAFDDPFACQAYGVA